MLQRRTPSQLEASTRIDLAERLRLDAGGSLERGSLVHAWCQEVGWIEEGLPDEERLRRIARRVAPAFGGAEVTALVERFRDWMAVPTIMAALSRASYPAATRIEREIRFVHRDGDTIVEGIIDRLLLWEEGGRVVGAEVLDYKTDAVTVEDSAGLEARTEVYRGQLSAYRTAVSRLYHLPPGEIGAKLLFLNAGVVRAV
jgi:ATP-dependent exoDNAse (exonuclease V) beta subunit